MQKLPVAILGSGNIGTDLMVKVGRSAYLELVAMAGIDPASAGLERARAAGILTTSRGLDGLMEWEDRFALVFDATSAAAHMRHAEVLAGAGKIAVDLTPAAVGPYVVPVVNLGQHLDRQNVNMITCGGQATIPIVWAISQVATVAYAEIVATIASKSAGPGTRQNIDEFTHTTARGIERVGGVGRGKAIIVLNPADPPIIMRDTVYAVLEEGDPGRITKSVRDMVQEVSRYVKGYQLRSDPLYDGNLVTVLLQVEGAGDYLPPYAGNLDIMTAAATRVGEEFAKRGAPWFAAPECNGREEDE